MASDLAVPKMSQHVRYSRLSGENDRVSTNLHMQREWDSVSKSALHTQPAAGGVTLKKVELCEGAVVG